MTQILVDVQATTRVDHCFEMERHQTVEITKYPMNEYNIYRVYKCIYIQYAYHVQINK